MYTPLIYYNFLSLPRRRRRDRGRAGDLLAEEEGGLRLAEQEESLVAPQAAQEAEHARVGVQDEGGEVRCVISCILMLNSA